MFQPKQATIDKNFFRNERNYYANWMQSFWRELVQNSVDAGAKRIDINVYDEVAISTFNQQKPESNKATRIEFNDNGCGMSLDTLENVYFKIGATSKNTEDTIGGFGRARLITCFGAERYTILTNDNYVEGSGNLYECSKITEAIDRKQSEIDFYTNLNNWNEVEAHTDILSKLKTYKEGIKGTQFTVDFDPEEKHDKWTDPTSNRMLTELYNYLWRSQLGCSIYINGNLFTDKCSKGTHIRTIMSPDSEFEIGKLHILKSGHSKKFGGEVIFRIDGAPMISRYISGDAQAVFELNKKNHRKVLTSNRDGFKEEFARPINDLIDEIVSDNISSLKDKTINEDRVVSGQRGDFQMKVQSPDIDITKLSKSEKNEIQEVINTGNLNYKYDEDIIPRNNFTDIGDVKEQLGIVQPETVNNLLNSIRNQNETFMDNYDNINDFQDIKKKSINKSNKDILSMMDKNMKRYLLAGLTTKTLAKVRESDKETKIHNVHIKIDNPNTEVKRVIKHFDPSNWSAENGKGKRIRMLLEAWNTACKEVTYILLKNNIHMMGASIRTGWLFTKPDVVWKNSVEKEYTTEAMHQKTDKNVHTFLINPVNTDGKLKYKITSEQDLMKLINLAAHEVTHMAVGPRHNEEFASVYTDLISSVLPKANEIIQKMKQNMSSAKISFEEDFSVDKSENFKL